MRASHATALLGCVIAGVHATVPLLEVHDVLYTVNLHEVRCREFVKVGGYASIGEAVRQAAILSQGLARLVEECDGDRNLTGPVRAVYLASGLSTTQVRSLPSIDLVESRVVAALNTSTDLAAVKHVLTTAVTNGTYLHLDAMTHISTDVRGCSLRHATSTTISSGVGGTRCVAVRCTYGFEVDASGACVATAKPTHDSSISTTMVLAMCAIGATMFLLAAIVFLFLYRRELRERQKFDAEEKERLRAKEEALAMRRAAKEAKEMEEGSREHSKEQSPAPGLLVSPSKHETSRNYARDLSRLTDALEQECIADDNSMSGRAGSMDNPLTSLSPDCMDPPAHVQYPPADDRGAMEVGSPVSPYPTSRPPTRLPPVVVMREGYTANARTQGPRPVPVSPRHASAFSSAGGGGGFAPHSPSQDSGFPKGPPACAPPAQQPVSPSARGPGFGPPSGPPPPAYSGTSSASPLHRGFAPRDGHPKGPPACAPPPPQSHSPSTSHSPHATSAHRRWGTNPTGPAEYVTPSPDRDGRYSPVNPVAAAYPTAQAPSRVYLGTSFAEDQMV